MQSWEVAGGSEFNIPADYTKCVKESLLSSLTHKISPAELDRASEPWSLHSRKPVGEQVQKMEPVAIADPVAWMLLLSDLPSGNPTWNCDPGLNEDDWEFLCPDT